MDAPVLRLHLRPNRRSSNAHSICRILVAGFIPLVAAEAACAGIVISQIYGGGGIAGAPFRKDFIELFNNGPVAVSVTGWSVQYTSAGGATWSVTPLASASISPGKYYLVQEDSTNMSMIGALLPTPDATGTIAMAVSSSKVALVSSTTTLAGACPIGGAIVDFVGYGPSASCFEGPGPTLPALNATTAALRVNNGCTDTNSNFGDFLTGPPTPRNSASPAAALPSCTISNFPASVCATTGGYSADGPPGVATYAWSITGGSINGASNLQTVAFTAGAAPGPLILTLNTTDPGGCKSTCMRSIPVIASPCAIPFPEAEPNETKATATPAFFMTPNNQLTGITIGALTTPGTPSLDIFKVRTAAATLGIYEYRLTITTVGGAEHVGAILGLTQSGGVIGTTDAVIQTSSAATMPPRYNQWYGFGKQEQIYYRITGTAATVNPYTVTLTRAQVAPGSLGTFTPGGVPGPTKLTLTTVGQGHANDTEIFVYNSNFDAIAGFLNDDEPAPGTTFGSRVTRAFSPGLYYMAIGNFNSANNLASPTDERFRDGDVMDFPNSLVNSDSTTATNLAFAIIDTHGSHPFPATRPNPFGIVWKTFMVTLPDCNTNNIDDPVDISLGASPDCNANGVPDECDIAAGAADCNMDLIPDVCQLSQPFSPGLTLLSPIDFGNPQTFTVINPPLAGSAVTLIFDATADLDQANEFISVSLNGTALGNIFVIGGAACPAPSIDTLIVSAAVWNAAVGVGRAVLDLFPSAAVDPCTPPSTIAVGVSYTVNRDCNHNMVLDSCDIASNISRDCNANGVPDECEPLQAFPDCNNNGTADSIDILLAISMDLDHNGVPDECRARTGPPGQAWSNPDLWVPNTVPNNVGPPPGFCVSLTGSSSDVVLDINATIDTMRLVLCSHLQAIQGSLTIATTRGIQNDALITVGNTRSLIANATPCPIRGFGVVRLSGPTAQLVSGMPGGMFINDANHTIAGQGIITADFKNLGLVSADSPTGALVLAGPGVKINDSLLQASHGGTMLIHTDVHDNPAAGALLASGGTIAIGGLATPVTVDGCGPADVEPMSPGAIIVDNASLMNSSRWRVGNGMTGTARIQLQNNSSGLVNGAIDVNSNGTLMLTASNVTANGAINVNNGGTLMLLTASNTTAVDLILANTAILSVAGGISLSGRLTFTGTDEMRWSWEIGATLTFAGGTAGCTPANWARLEAGGRDAGPMTGYSNNFDLSILRVNANHALLLVDEANNGNRNGPGGAAEAVYADSLVLQSNAVLNLNHLHLYVGGMPVNPGPFGGGTVVNYTVPGMPGDTNHDGALNGGDIQIFVYLLFAGGYDCSADLNHDGMVNLLDLSMFVSMLLV